MLFSHSYEAIPIYVPQVLKPTPTVERIRRREKTQQWRQGKKYLRIQSSAVQFLGTIGRSVFFLAHLLEAGCNRVWKNHGSRHVNDCAFAYRVDRQI